MNSYALRGLDAELGKAIKEHANTKRLSVNKWLIDAIRTACGLDKPNLFRQHHDLDHLAGTWTAKEADTFKRNTTDFERIDKDLWK